MEKVVGTRRGFGVESDTRVQLSPIHSNCLSCRAHPTPCVHCVPCVLRMRPFAPAFRARLSRPPGTTLKYIKAYLLSKGVKSVKIACLLSKMARRTEGVEVDYIGFDCPDEFVVGYGMDFAEEYVRDVRDGRDVRDVRDGRDGRDVWGRREERGREREQAREEEREAS